MRRIERAAAPTSLGVDARSDSGVASSTSLRPALVVHPDRLLPPEPGALSPRAWPASTDPSGTRFTVIRRGTTDTPVVTAMVANGGLDPDRAIELILSAGRGSLTRSPPPRCGCAAWAPASSPGIALRVDGGQLA